MASQVPAGYRGVCPGVVVFGKFVSFSHVLDDPADSLLRAADGLTSVEKSRLAKKCNCCWACICFL